MDSKIPACLSDILLKWMIITDTINVFVHTYTNLTPLNKYRSTWKGLMSQAVRFHSKCNGNPSTLINLVSQKKHEIEKILEENPQFVKILTEDTCFRPECHVSDYLGIEQICDFFKFRSQLRDGRPFSSEIYQLIHQAFFSTSLSTDRFKISPLPRRCSTLIMTYINNGEIEEFGPILNAYLMFYGIKEE